MTDDLMTRLRAHEEPITSRDGVVTYESVKVCQEAADRIEKDAETIARLEGECRESAMDALLAYGQATDAYEAQLKVEAKVAALVEALERIAEGPKVGDLMEPWIVGVMTRARAAIAAAKGGNEISADAEIGHATASRITKGDVSTTSDD